MIQPCLTLHFIKVEIHLLQLQDSFASNGEIQLMRCADYFAHAFASVTTASFQWHNILKENSLTKASEVCGNLMHRCRQCH
jgi:hypothetical protein